MVVTKIITTDTGEFTDPLSIPALTDPQKKTSFNLSVSETFEATITVQRRFDEGTWLDVETFTEPGEFIGDEIESNVEYRAGVKTGDFTSGTVELRLGVN